MTNALDGQVAIVTGGTGDVGAGVCRALTRAGATVVALDIDVERPHDANRAIRCDVSDPSDCGAAVDEVVRDFGGVHTLVNMAQYIGDAKPLLETTDDDMVRSLESGPTGTLRMMKLCHPHLKAAGGGAIVNFGSGAGTNGMATRGPYAAAKEAIRGITKTASLEWGHDNIRVNVVCPMAASDPARLPPDVAERNPLGRVGDPELDVGAAVVFLAGAGRFITGRTIHVDGGGGTYR
jgi:NAD(P)-dependent dehydrogenase (short-subunit alcohol dehydrogenase family)